MLVFIHFFRIEQFHINTFRIGSFVQKASPWKVDFFSRLLSRQCRTNQCIVFLPLVTFHRYKERRWDFKKLVGSGGMPSSHSSTVSALAIAIGLQEGFGASVFAVALILACVVWSPYPFYGIHYGLSFKFSWMILRC